MLFPTLKSNKVNDSINVLFIITAAFNFQFEVSKINDV